MKVADTGAPLEASETVTVDLGTVVNVVEGFCGAPALTVTVIGCADAVTVTVAGLASADVGAAADEDGTGGVT